jgi:hypothetical protein
LISNPTKHKLFRNAGICADTVLPKTYAFNIAVIGAAKMRAAKMQCRGRQIGHLPDR